MTILGLFYVLLILSVMLLGGCTDVCENERRYTYYEPVYTTLEELRSFVKQEDSRDIEQLGKLYLKSGYLYLNEPGLGLHVIDNRNPSDLQNISFINIPGNRSLSAKGNFLYVDSYVDLVVLDITNPTQIVEINRVKNVFND